MPSSRRKDRRALALGYRRDLDQAPRVLASGRGAVAEHILKLAREHRIPIRSEPDLLELLQPLDLGEEIPLPAYKAVAEILAFLYRVGQG
ncbi:MAG: EscU/YscU/HrcU family type III secretion system export apparatus switch protein [Planctomycetota bacterium]